MAGEKKIDSTYRNPTGIMSYEELWRLKNASDEEQEVFHRQFKITETPCPPDRLRPHGNVCFHCKECFEYAISKVKKKDVQKNTE